MTAALDSTLEPLTVEGDSPLLPASFTSDQELRALARTSRAAAIEQVVRKYEDRLLSHAQYILHDAQTAQDVVQEVFIKAMREQRLFDDDFKIQAWLYRVTRNLCFNLSRDRRRRDTLLQGAGRPQAGEPAEIPQAQIGPDPLHAVFEDERREAVMGAVELLTEDHREILLLRYYEDLSYAEIADRLDIKLGTVMSRLSRARDRLLEKIGVGTTGDPLRRAA